MTFDAQEPIGYTAFSKSITFPETPMTFVFRPYWNNINTAKET